MAVDAGDWCVMATTWLVRAGVWRWTSVRGIPAVIPAPLP